MTEFKDEADNPEVAVMEINWGEPSHTMTLVDGFEIHFTDKYRYPNWWYRFWHKIFFGFRYRLEE